METTDLKMRGNVSPRTEKWIRVSAVMAMLIVALSSAILSFDGLQRLALESKISPQLTFLFPIAIDVTILMGSLAVLLYEMFGIRAVFGWFTVLFGTALSVTGNVISVADAGITAQILHGIIPVLLCISLESLLRILRFNIRRTASFVENSSAPHINNRDTKTEPEVNNVVQQEVIPSENVEDEKLPPEIELQINNNPEKSKHVYDPENSLEDPTSQNGIALAVANQETVPVDNQKVASSMPNASVGQLDTEENSTITKPDDSVNATETSRNLDEKPASKTVSSPPSATTKKTTKKGGGHPALPEWQKDDFRELVRKMPDAYPGFKKLGEVMKIKREISSADIRYIMDLPSNKRVDALVKKARDFASEQ